MNSYVIIEKTESVVPSISINKLPGQDNFMVSSTEMSKNISFISHTNFSKNFNKWLLSPKLAHILGNQLDTWQQQYKRKKLQVNLILEY